MPSEVILTDKIERWIQCILETESLPVELRTDLEMATCTDDSCEGPRTILFGLVRNVHDYMKNKEDAIYLHELLEGSDVYLPEAKVVQRDPELEQRVQNLRVEQQNKDYDEMTKNVSFGSFNDSTTALSPGEEVKQLNHFLVIIFNFLMTVIGSFAASYKITEFILDVPNVPMQICSGMIVATVVFFADLYFLIKYDSIKMT